MTVPEELESAVAALLIVFGLLNCPPRVQPLNLNTTTRPTDFPASTFLLELRFAWYKPWAFGQPPRSCEGETACEGNTACEEHTACEANTGGGGRTRVVLFELHQAPHQTNLDTDGQ